MTYNGSKNGNVLFLILIAVALFAALSYAITQSSRGGGSEGVSPEKARIAASEILQYALLVEETVKRIRIINGCSDFQLSFQNILDANHINPGAPADKRCHIFDAAGGGLAPRKFLLSGVNRLPNYATRSTIPYIGTTCTDASCVELYFWLRTIDKVVCMEFNKLVNFDNAANDAPTLSGFYGTPFQGTYTYGNTPAGFNGKYSGCHRDASEIDANGNPYYDFYHLILAR